MNAHLTQMQHHVAIRVVMRPAPVPDSFHLFQPQNLRVKEQLQVQAEGFLTIRHHHCNFCHDTRIYKVLQNILGICKL